MLASKVAPRSRGVSPVSNGHHHHEHLEKSKSGPATVSSKIANTKVYATNGSCGSIHNINSLEGDFFLKNHNNIITSDNGSGGFLFGGEEGRAADGEREREVEDGYGGIFVCVRVRSVPSTKTTEEGGHGNYNDSWRSNAIAISVLENTVAVHDPNKIQKLIHEEEAQAMGGGRISLTSRGNERSIIGGGVGGGNASIAACLSRDYNTISAYGSIPSAAAAAAASASSSLYVPCSSVSTHTALLSATVTYATFDACCVSMPKNQILEMPLIKYSDFLTYEDICALSSSSPTSTRDAMIGNDSMASPSPASPPRSSSSISSLIKGSQKDVYELTAAKAVIEAIRGVNACVFGYGQTGSGKTYTMFGGDTSNLGGYQPGVVPRTLADIFVKLENKKKRSAVQKRDDDWLSGDGGDSVQTPPLPSVSSSFAYEVSIGFLEIYQKDVSCLISKKKNLAIREGRDGPFVEGLKLVKVTTADEALRVIEAGLRQRKTADTKMNAESSRSHAIVQVHIHQTIMSAAGDDEIRLETEEISLTTPLGNVRSSSPSLQQIYGRQGSPQRNNNNNNKRFFSPHGSTMLSSIINLVDLAGSERQKKSQTSGLTTKEGTEINLSLSHLARVINEVSAASLSSTCSGGASGTSSGTFVNYRASKLTHLLKESLGGNCKTFMIAAISPTVESHLETLSTLKYAQNVRNIRNKPIINKKLQVRADLQNEVVTLRRELEGAKRQLGVYAVLFSEQQHRHSNNNNRETVADEGEGEEEGAHLINDDRISISRAESSVGNVSKVNSIVSYRNLKQKEEAEAKKAKRMKEYGGNRLSSPSSSAASSSLAVVSRPTTTIEIDYLSENHQDVNVGQNGKGVGHLGPHDLDPNDVVDENHLFITEEGGEEVGQGNAVFEVDNEGLVLSRPSRPSSWLSGDVTHQPRSRIPTQRLTLNASEVLSVLSLSSSVPTINVIDDDFRMQAASGLRGSDQHLQVNHSTIREQCENTSASPDHPSSYLPRPSAFLRSSTKLPSCGVENSHLDEEIEDEKIIKSGAPETASSPLCAVVRFSEPLTKPDSVLLQQASENYYSRTSTTLPQSKNKHEETIKPKEQTNSNVYNSIVFRESQQQTAPSNVTSVSNAFSDNNHPLILSAISTTTTVRTATNTHDDFVSIPTKAHRTEVAYFQPADTKSYEDGDELDNMPVDPAWIARIGPLLFEAFPNCPTETLASAVSDTTFWAMIDPDFIESTKKSRQVEYDEEENEQVEVHIWCNNSSEEISEDTHIKLYHGSVLRCEVLTTTTKQTSTGGMATATAVEKLETFIIHFLDPFLVTSAASQQLHLGRSLTANNTRINSTVTSRGPSPPSTFVRSSTNVNGNATMRNILPIRSREGSKRIFITSSRQGSQGNNNNNIIMLSSNAANEALQAENSAVPQRRDHRHVGDDETETKDDNNNNNNNNNNININKSVIAPSPLRSSTTINIVDCLPPIAGPSKSHFPALANIRQSISESIARSFIDVNVRGGSDSDSNNILAGSAEGKRMSCSAERLVASSSPSPLKWTLLTTGGSEENEKKEEQEDKKDTCTTTSAPEQRDSEHAAPPACQTTRKSDGGNSDFTALHMTVQSLAMTNLNFRLSGSGPFANDDDGAQDPRPLDLFMSAVGGQETSAASPLSSQPLQNQRIASASSPLRSPMGFELPPPSPARSLSRTRNNDKNSLTADVSTLREKSLTTKSRAKETKEEEEDKSSSSTVANKRSNSGKPTTSQKSAGAEEEEDEDERVLSTMMIISPNRETLSLSEAASKRGMQREKSGAETHHVNDKDEDEIGGVEVAVVINGVPSSITIPRLPLAQLQREADKLLSLAQRQEEELEYAAYQREHSQYRACRSRTRSSSSYYHNSPSLGAVQQFRATNQHTTRKNSPSDDAVVGSNTGCDDHQQNPSVDGPATSQSQVHVDVMKGEDTVHRHHSPSKSRSASSVSTEAAAATVREVPLEFEHESSQRDGDGESQTCQAGAGNHETNSSSAAPASPSPPTPHRNTADHHERFNCSASPPPVKMPGAALRTFNVTIKNQMIPATAARMMNEDDEDEENSPRHGSFGQNSVSQRRGLSFAASLSRAGSVVDASRHQLLINELQSVSAELMRRNAVIEKLRKQNALMKASAAVVENSNNVSTKPEKGNISSLRRVVHVGVEDSRRSCGEEIYNEHHNQNHQYDEELVGEKVSAKPTNDEATTTAPEDEREGVPYSITDNITENEIKRFIEQDRELADLRLRVESLTTKERSLTDQIENLDQLVSDLQEELSESCNNAVVHNHRMFEQGREIDALVVRLDAAETFLSDEINAVEAMEKSIDENYIELSTLDVLNEKLKEMRRLASMWRRKSTLLLLQLQNKSNSAAVHNLCLTVHNDDKEHLDEIDQINKELLREREDLHAEIDLLRESLLSVNESLETKTNEAVEIKAVLDDMTEQLLLKQSELDEFVETTERESAKIKAKQRLSETKESISLRNSIKKLETELTEAKVRELDLTRRLKDTLDRKRQLGSGTTANPTTTATSSNGTKGNRRSSATALTASTAVLTTSVNSQVISPSTFSEREELECFIAALSKSLLNSESDEKDLPHHQQKQQEDTKNNFSFLLRADLCRCALNSLLQRFDDRYSKGNSMNNVTTFDLQDHATIRLALRLLTRELKCVGGRTNFLNFQIGNISNLSTMISLLSGGLVLGTNTKQDIAKITDSDSGLSDIIISRTENNGTDEKSSKTSKIDALFEHTFVELRSIVAEIYASSVCSSSSIPSCTEESSSSSSLPFDAYAPKGLRWPIQVRSKESLALWLLSAGSAGANPPPQPPSAEEEGHEEEEKDDGKSALTTASGHANPHQKSRNNSGNKRLASLRASVLGLKGNDDGRKSKGSIKITLTTGQAEEAFSSERIRSSRSIVNEHSRRNIKRLSLQLMRLVVWSDNFDALSAKKDTLAYLEIVRNSDVILMMAEVLGHAMTDPMSLSLFPSSASASAFSSSFSSSDFVKAVRKQMELFQNQMTVSTMENGKSVNDLFMISSSVSPSIMMAEVEDIVDRIVNTEAVAAERGQKADSALRTMISSLVSNQFVSGNKDTALFPIETSLSERELEQSRDEEDENESPSPARLYDDDDDVYGGNERRSGLMRASVTSTTMLATTSDERKAIIRALSESDRSRKVDVTRAKNEPKDNDRRSGARDLSSSTDRISSLLLDFDYHQYYNSTEQMLDNNGHFGGGGNGNQKNGKQLRTRLTTTSIPRASERQHQLRLQPHDPEHQKEERERVLEKAKEDASQALLALRNETSYIEDLLITGMTNDVTHVSVGDEAKKECESCTSDSEKEGNQRNSNTNNNSSTRTSHRNSGRESAAEAQRQLEELGRLESFFKAVTTPTVTPNATMRIANATDTTSVCTPTTAENITISENATTMATKATSSYDNDNDKTKTMGTTTNITASQQLVDFFRSDGSNCHVDRADNINATEYQRNEVSPAIEAVAAVTAAAAAVQPQQPNPTTKAKEKEEETVITKETTQRAGGEEEAEIERNEEYMYDELHRVSSIQQCLSTTPSQRLVRSSAASNTNSSSHFLLLHHQLTGHSSDRLSTISVATRESEQSFAAAAAIASTTVSTTTGDNEKSTETPQKEAYMRVSTSSSKYNTAEAEAAATATAGTYYIYPPSCSDPPLRFSDTAAFLDLKVIPSVSNLNETNTTSTNASAAIVTVKESTANTCRDSLSDSETISALSHATAYPELTSKMFGSHSNSSSTRNSSNVINTNNDNNNKNDNAPSSTTTCTVATATTTTNQVNAAITSIIPNPKNPSTSHSLSLSSRFIPPPPSRLGGVVGTVTKPSSSSVLRSSAIPSLSVSQRRFSNTSSATSVSASSVSSTSASVTPRSAAAAVHGVGPLTPQTQFLSRTTSSMSQSLIVAEKKKAAPIDKEKGNGKNDSDAGIGLGGGFFKGLRGLVGGFMISAGAVSPTSSSTTPRTTKMGNRNKTDEAVVHHHNNEDVASALLHFKDDSNQPRENLKRMSTNAVAGGSPKFEKERLLSQTLAGDGNDECCNDDKTDGVEGKGQQHYSENRVHGGKLSIFADDIPYSSKQEYNNVVDNGTFNNKKPQSDLSNPFLTFVGDDDAVHAEVQVRYVVGSGGAHRDGFFVNNNNNRENDVERNKSDEPTPPMTENRSPSSSSSSLLKQKKNHSNDNPFLRLSSGVISTSDDENGRKSESAKGSHHTVVSVRAFGSSLTNK